MAERLLTLKFLLHFVGDVHQPLHASNNHDRGGNCVLISLGGQRTQNLHTYWDTAVVEALGIDPVEVAAKLRSMITSALQQQWQQGDPSAWSQEAFEVACTTAYTIGSPAGCPQEAAPVPLPAGYAAQAAAAIQLEQAGVRLAMVLSRALAAVPMPAAL